MSHDSVEHDPVNVVIDEAGKKRILAADKTWSGPKLVILTLVTMAFAIAALVAMAHAPFSQGAGM